LRLYAACLEVLENWNLGKWKPYEKRNSIPELRCYMPLDGFEFQCKIALPKNSAVELHL